MGSTFVTGSTGTIGRRVAAALERRGADVVVATRDTQRAQALFESRTTVRRFDFADPSTHAAALAGSEQVFLAGPPLVPDVDRLLAPFIDHLAAHGPRRVVYLSAYGLEDPADPLMGFHARIEARLRAQFDATILRPGFFTSNFGLYLAADVARGTIALPAGDSVTPWIDPDDVAEAAATALRDPSTIGRTFVLTGDEPLGFAQAAQRISDVVGHRVAYVALTDSAFRDGALAAGLPATLAAYLVAVYGLIARGAVAAPTGDLRALLGRAPTPFDTALRKSLASAPGG